MICETNQLTAPGWHAWRLASAQDEGSSVEVERRRSTGMMHDNETG